MDTVRHYSFPYNLSKMPIQSEVKRPFLSADGAKKHILLTGGASCPDGIIQQVIHKINSFFPPESIRSVESILEAFESEG